MLWQFADAQKVESGIGEVEDYDIELPVQECADNARSCGPCLITVLL